MNSPSSMLTLTFSITAINPSGDSYSGRDESDEAGDGSEEPDE
jgi:hypothetical protein